MPKTLRQQQDNLLDVCRQHHSGKQACEPRALLPISGIADTSADCVAAAETLLL